MSRTYVDTNTPIKKISLDIRFIDPHARIKEDRHHVKPKRNQVQKPVEIGSFLKKRLLL